MRGPPEPRLFATLSKLASSRDFTTGNKWGQTDVTIMHPSQGNIGVAYRGMLLNRGYFIRGFYTVNFHRLIFQCNIGWLSLSFLLVCSSRDLEGGPEDVLGTPHSCTQRLGYKALFLSISRKVGTSEHSISSRKIFTR